MFVRPNYRLVNIVILVGCLFNIKSPCSLLVSSILHLYITIFGTSSYRMHMAILILFVIIDLWIAKGYIWNYWVWRKRGFRIIQGGLQKLVFSPLHVVIGGHKSLLSVKVIYPHNWGLRLYTEKTLTFIILRKPSWNCILTLYFQIYKSVRCFIA